MKLSKKTLIRLVKPQLIAMGFTEFKDSIFGTSGLFINKVDHGLYLSLGMNIHRFYESLFTCDLFFSRTTRIYSCWGDIPRNCCMRPGYLLNNDELLKYSKGEDMAPDIWWDASNEDDINNFFKVLNLTIPRHTANNLLINLLYESDDLTRLCELSSLVIEMIRCGELDDHYPYSFIPCREIDNIPMKWFCAAEIILRKERINETKYLSNLVKQLAADAYRQFRLNA